MPGASQRLLQEHPMDPEAVLALADKGRGLYEDLVRRLQDPRPDPALPGLVPNYYIEPWSPEDAAVGDEMQVALANAGHPFSDYVYIRILNSSAAFPSPNATAVDI
ncbi:hypothetical protein B0T25DRAFT_571512 [Lasiosphaeria hispida]|uniref:Uncharacterized protein n=1 Tax=Lasiosphaeria hispida TaxID=260671 RepID=A0AAJ0HB53_9PEZI|nr:hypothetical protein B0T25DRAFT_571512 [Lasiosphaeria hispida]